VWNGVEEMKSDKKGNKIMVVDDEPDITMSFEPTLQNAGFIVHTYQDPLIALSKFKPSYYDLVILDIKMPKMSGFELYAEIQKIDNKLKVCFITAGQMYYDKVREKERYCKLDAERFLQKPITNVELVKRIEKIMMLNNSPNIQSA
jgi:DNA-binding response OmpR family regulator